MRTRLTGAVFALLLFAGSGLSQDISDSSVEGLESRIQKILDENNTPGLIGAIISRDKVIWQGALGIADRNTGRPVTTDTLFRVGSISKSFVSLSILKLVEKGDLSLDLVVNEVVPEAGVNNPWENTNPIRLYHVLEHTAGFDDLHLRDYNFSDPNVTTLQGIQFNRGSRDARWRPGTRMSYSNMGPPVAALVLEKVTGESFEEFVDREVFKALDMKTATFMFDEAVAASYSDDGSTNQPYAHISVRSSGALNASSADMIQLLKMYLNRGKVAGQTFISKKSLDRMEKSTSTLAAKQGLSVGYGLSNYTTQKNGFVMKGHNGGIDGFISTYAYLPEFDVGYFFSINAGNGKAFVAINDEVTTFTTRDLLPPKPVSSVEIPTGDVADYIGYYQPDSPRAEIARAIETLSGVVMLDYRDGELSIGAPFDEKQKYLPVGDQKFIKEGDALPSLILVESDLGEKFVQGGAGPTLIKISPVYAFTRWAGAAAEIRSVFAMKWVLSTCR